MLRFIFEMLSMADWISPVIETGKDFNHLATGLRGTFDISVDKGELNYAKQIIKRSGYQVISTSTVAFDSEALITVECFGGADGYDSVRMIQAALQNEGIDTWVSPGWA